MPVEDRVTKTLDRVEDNRILLFHDTNERTVEAMKTLIPELKARGYEIVTVPELFRLSGHTPPSQLPEDVLTASIEKVDYTFCIIQNR